MWFEEAEELFKGYFPYYLLIVLPMFIIISPITPASAAYDFPVFRMQQFDVVAFSTQYSGNFPNSNPKQNGQFGSRSASVNLEARSLHTWSTSRHCVITRMQDLTIDHFHNIRTKAGALLIIISDDLSNLSPIEKQHFMTLEDVMLNQETPIPIYFVVWTPEVERILEEVSTNVIVEDKAKTAAETLINSIAANGYQVVINARTPAPKQDIQIATLVGSLSGYDGNLPSIFVVAHYDSFGVAPELSHGADSNGSGVVVLLELMRLFSLLYSDPKTHGKYNIVFALTGGGKLNYIGSKKWLEEEHTDLNTSPGVNYVMCLDTLAASDSIYMHVSKPPNSTTSSGAVVFMEYLKTTTEKYPSVSFDLIHKRIHLREILLPWEHERYSLKRVHAFTLSSLKNHKDPYRRTILDTKNNFNMDRLVQNTKIISEALAGYIYNVSEGDLFGGTLKVEKSHLEAWIKFLSSQPRSPQLLSGKDNPVVSFLKDSFNKYLRNVQVKYILHEKDPDFVLYEGTKSTANFYSVKPAVFDLILTLIIVVYLSGAYIVIQNFSGIYRIACNVTGKTKIQ